MDINNALFQKAVSVLTVHGAKKVGVFGSYVRGRPEQIVILIYWLNSPQRRVYWNWSGLNGKFQRLWE
jgi:hypothetical protein